LSNIQALKKAAKAAFAEDLIRVSAAKLMVSSHLWLVPV